MGLLEGWRLPPIDDGEAAEPYLVWSIESLLAVLRRRAGCLVEVDVVMVGREDDDDEMEEAEAAVGL